MDYAALLQQLSEASLFDLHRLRASLDRMMEDLARIAKVKAHLRLGMRITYFEDSENRLIEAEILELHRSRLLVKNVATNGLWNIYYSSVNLEGVNVDMPAAAGNMDRSAWKVGDPVAFKDRQNCDVYGTITKLNPKTATVVLKNNQKWTVGYSWLIPVLESGAQPPHSWQDLPMGGSTLRVIEACEPDGEVG